MKQSMGAAMASTSHPHEPEIPPVIAEDGHCRICRLTLRLAEAEGVVYALCDAWDGDRPDHHLDDPGGVLTGVWMDAAAYHARYRMQEQAHA